MENKQYSESNYPTGTWESIWIGQITKAIEEWHRRRFMDSLRTTKILYSWLPEEVKAEAKPKLDEIENMIKNALASESVERRDNEAEATAAFQWVMQHAHYSAARLDYFLFSSLLELQSLIQSSLEDHGWICKAVGASPQVKHKKEAWA